MTVERRRLNKSRVIAAFAITLLVFIIGIMTGNYFSSKKVSYLETMSSDFRTDTLALEIQYDLLKENPCKETTATPLAKQLYDIATKLDYMESKLGEDNKEVEGLISFITATIIFIITLRMSEDTVGTKWYSYLLFIWFYIPLYTYWWVESALHKAIKGNVVWKGRQREHVS